PPSAWGIVSTSWPSIVGFSTEVAAAGPTLEELERTALKAVAVAVFESPALDVKNVDDARAVKKPSSPHRPRGAEVAGEGRLGRPEGRRECGMRVPRGN